MPRQFPALDTDVREITATALKRRLDGGEELTLLDTRRPSDFEAWQLTHPNLTTINVPFTAFMEDDLETPVSSLPAEVEAQLPDDLLITCCAKGLSSFFVAEVLAREGWDVLALEDGMEGWAALLEDRTLDVDGVEVVQFHRPSSGCLSYLLVAGDEVAVVDPLRVFATDYADAAVNRGASIRYAIDTHVHADHVSGVRAVAAQTDATVVLPTGATERGLAFDATLIGEGEALSLGDAELDAVPLPGHTSEMMGYRLGDVLLTGDTLFLDGVARPDLEDPREAREAATTLWETLQELAEEPADTVVAPGHAGPTTAPGTDGTFTARLGALRERLQAFSEPQDAFVERILAELPPQPPNHEELIEINLGHQSADQEEAFELELGPNNCAVAEVATD